MRPNSPLAAILAVAGIAWLAYKSSYLGMNAPLGLKALIVSPGAGLLIAAAFVAFSDARRRTAASLLVVGALALAVHVLEAQPTTGWTFYTPYASVSEVPGAWPQHGGVSPWLVGLAALGVALGLALALRRSVAGLLLLGLAGWLTAVRPSRLVSEWRFGGDDGMPRRDHYYYFAGPSLPEWIDWAVPLVLAALGLFFLIKERRSSTSHGL